MKTVMKNDMVAHVWAAQSQSEARNAQGNFYFRDSAIYSYGGHFPIARFVKNKRGKSAVLFTTRSYSNTTSKHICTVRQALYGLEVPRFYVRDPSAINVQTAREDYESRIRDALEKAVRARGRKFTHLQEARDLAKEANDLAQFYGERWRIPVPASDEAGLEQAKLALQKHEMLVAKRNRAAIKAQEKALAERRAREQTEREAWLRGEDVDYPYDYERNAPTLLRVYGDVVQTSRGAEIPVCHAKRLWPMILKCKQEGDSFVAGDRTIHVGHFALREIYPNGDIKVGCHYIKWDQIEKIAGELGLLQTEAA
jgi:hypothetical protein